MKCKVTKYALHIIAAGLIVYASTAATVHHHVTHHHNCIICHFQYHNATDIHPPITFGSFHFLQYIFFENLPYIFLINNYTTSRSPPVLLT